MGVEVRRARRRTGLPQDEFGLLIGLNTTYPENAARTVRRWEMSETTVPGPVALLMEAIAEGWLPKSARKPGYCGPDPA